MPEDSHVGVIQSLMSPDGKYMNGSPGISLRAHFAGLAMAACLSNPEFDFGAERVAETAVLFADCLIERLNKPTT